MKKYKFQLLIGAFIWISCQNNEEACDQPPCVQPNINITVGLKLSFPESNEGDEVGIIRINKFNGSIIDTTLFTLDMSKKIEIGRGGKIGFREKSYGKPVEQGTLDYGILVSNEQKYLISNIQIEGLPGQECSCPDYQISTLQLNQDTIEVNSSTYTLEL